MHSVFIGSNTFNNPQMSFAVSMVINMESSLLKLDKVVQLLLKYNTPILQINGHVASNAIQNFIKMPIMFVMSRLLMLLCRLLVIFLYLFSDKQKKPLVLYHHQYEIFFYIENYNQANY